MPYQLQSREIQVCGETLTVFQASNLMEIRRSMMISDADKKWEGQEPQEIEGQARRYLETLLFPSLVACTTGPVPTLEEFVHSLPAGDSETWMAAAREMNPRWFPDIARKTPDEEAAVLEKNE